MSKTIYLDADYLVYSMGYASEIKMVMPDGTTVKRSNLTGCKRLINKQIEKYCDLFQTDNYVLCLSGTGNFRLSYYPLYKNNRLTLVKPLCYDGIRKWIQEQPETVLVNGEEADDWLAAKLTSLPESDKANHIIVSADKDFFTVPGSVYNLSTKRLFQTTVAQSLCFLLLQAMMGDRVDGYYGVSWLGKVKARRLLFACRGKSIRQTYLFVKRLIMERCKTLEEKRTQLGNFRTCLSLAALRWTDEVGTHGNGLLRIFRHRNLAFEYYLPYYETEHNLKYGTLIERDVMEDY